MSEAFSRIFWTGLAVRIAAVPFLLQWFHPDERQLLEFAHFHAHGRLHPFLEVGLHLRNQTLPILFSLWVRLCDALGLAHPWNYLMGIHLAIAVWSWLGLFALVRVFQEIAPSQERSARRLGWFLALFWGFPFLYSRGMLEAVALPPVCFLLLSVLRRKAFHAGIWAGLAGVLRYPGALWAPGAALLWIWLERKRPPTERRALQTAASAFLGLGLAVGVGGLADLWTYGRFLESAPAYWSFNRPHGPVESMFGSDSLDVYWRWFAFLFTPWVAPFFLFATAVSLTLNPSLLIFCLPYVAGHLWTPHREPRFMLPLTPIFALAIAATLARIKSIETGGAFVSALQPAPKARKALVALALAHVLLNFAWYPLYAWGQWMSAQGKLIRHYNDLAAQPTDLLQSGEGDLMIDALLPESTRWADAECRWHRPRRLEATRVWVRANAPPEGCRAAVQDRLPELLSPHLPRLLRIRVGGLWECPSDAIRRLCPQGLQESPPGEPLREIPKAAGALQLTPLPRSSPRA